MANTSLALGVSESFYDVVYAKLVFDEEVDSWFLMPSPWPVFTIVGLYLLFVLKVGPSWMKNREPFELKNILFVYNIFQSLYNAMIVYWLFSTPGALSYMWKHSCHPMERSNNVFLLNQLNQCIWYFFISKLLDLLDTVFFVLRKKQSHISFLHVYHHSNMVITIWAYLRFIKGEESIIPAVINSSVHTIMYFYYFLAAFGPRMRPYLWWKAYLTRYQITQFMFILVWYTGHFYYNCNFHEFFIYYISANVLIFLYLFVRFYRQTYNKKLKTN